MAIDPGLGRPQSLNHLEDETSGRGLRATDVLIAAIRIGGYGAAGFLDPQVADLSDQEVKRQRRFWAFDRIKTDKFTFEPQPDPRKPFGENVNRVCRVCCPREIR